MLCFVSAISYSDSEAMSISAKLVTKLSLDEKLSLIHGDVSGAYVGNIPGVPRLSIPPLTMNDGPQGFRTPDNLKGTTTAWPAALTVASTWNRTTVREWGIAMGKEFKNKGSNVFLGPGMCIARIPVNGRNFEYMSGEDPVLGRELVPELVRGVQDQGIIANAKHYLHNNQETDRMTTNSVIDERTQAQIYLPPFEAAVSAGVLSIMCSYNRVNGVYACENADLLQDILRDRLGFKGFVMSDWGATHSTVAAAMSGLDQEMPDSRYFGTFREHISNGTIPLTQLDTMVTRILYASIKAGLHDATFPGALSSNVTCEENNRLARDIAAESMILLKNRNVLPIDTSKVNSIAVIGDAASDSPIIAGFGSGSVAPPYIVTALQGIRARAGPKIQVTYANSKDVTLAAQTASNADIAIIVTGTISSEAWDRPHLSFDSHELDLINAVADSQSQTVVYGISPGAILLPFEDKVPGIILSVFPGQEVGNSLADILFGDVNPSGKLPITIPNSENELGLTSAQYPGVDLVSTYTERLEVGYRWYNAHDVTPHYPFGHGLSYTRFEYSSLQVSASAVSFQLTNSGNMSGSEVAQVYLTFPEVAGEPPVQLKGFEKVKLNPGESTQVTVSFASHDFSIWDVEIHDWKPQEGVFIVLVGSSSRDIRLKSELSMSSA